MNIKIKEESFKYEFGSLKVGDIFKYEGELFIKIESDFDAYGDIIQNVLSLDAYTIGYILPKELVTIPIEKPKLILKFPKEDM